MKYNTWLNLYRLTGVLLGTGIMMLGAATQIDSNTLLFFSSMLMAAAVFLFMFVATTATSEENKKGDFIFSVKPEIKAAKKYVKAAPAPKQLTGLKRIPKQITA